MEFALLLLLVGMVTVFVALAFVVWVGNGIILYVNKYVPEQVVVAAKTTQRAVSGVIDSKKMAAIVSAVDIATKGKGKVVSIEKA